MNLDSGQQDQQQKDFLQSFYSQDSNRDHADLFHGSNSAPQPSMNFPPSLANMPVGMDVLESLMAMQNNTNPQAVPMQAQTTPQALIDQQMARLTQLQQLQQLQNQIFQQQVSIWFCFVQTGKDGMVGCIVGGGVAKHHRSVVPYLLSLYPCAVRPLVPWSGAGPTDGYMSGRDRTSAIAI
ncbi:hypothetical protein OBBRIDRAFT_285123 [Obba rivulosa]|uniref:Uncharacterized protein n=1 Tax=Obba rivulosa TaxID=1052685 RepID=A0A8E2AUU5_9APHY|nr:hypothetical protein OBBRIDRAFT_285123 [Obba rivulosa]